MGTFSWPKLGTLRWPLTTPAFARRTLWWFAASPCRTTAGVPFPHRLCTHRFWWSHLLHEEPPFTFVAHSRPLNFSYATSHRLTRGDRDRLNFLSVTETPIGPPDGRYYAYSLHHIAGTGTGHGAQVIALQGTHVFTVRALAGDYPTGQRYRVTPDRDGGTCTFRVKLCQVQSGLELEGHRRLVPERQRGLSGF